MRIALVLPGFSHHANDWAIPALLNLANELARHHDLHIFSQRYPAKGRYQFNGFTHHALGGGQRFGPASLKVWLQSAQAIIRQHQQTPFDVLHAFWADEAGFSAVLAGARLKRPVVVSLGGGELTHLPAINYGAQRFLIRRLTTRHALKRACFVTAGSTYQLDLCRAHHVPESKLHLAPLGVDTHQFQPDKNTMKAFHSALAEKKEPLSALTLIQVASMLPVKNQALLLQILHRVKTKLPNIHLNLVGAGPLQAELSASAQALDLTHNIAWHQQVSYPQTPRIYQQAHLYVQTSHHESQGMAVLEAMACGLPVVGTPVGVAKDVACLPAQISKEGLARQIIEILTDPSHYQQFSQQARQVVIKNFELGVVTHNFLKIYEACMLPPTRSRY